MDSRIGENPISREERPLKNPHPVSRIHAFVEADESEIAHTPRRRRVVDYAAAAVEQMKHYCVERPGSPSAVRRPELLFRGDLWIALLGPNMEEGIVGIGPTVAGRAPRI